MKIGVIVMALFGLLNAEWLSGFFDSTPTPYYTMSIDLSKAGNVVESDIRIDKKYSVEILLDLYSYTRMKAANKTSQASRDKYAQIQEKYFGGMGNSLPIFPIKLTIEKYGIHDMETVVDQVYYTNLRTTTSSRLIGEFKLQNGKYHVKVETVEDYPELAYLDVVVEIDYVRAK